MSFIIDSTLDIAAPAEVVWEVITDLPRYGEWNPFVVECRSSLKPGDAIDMKVQLVGKPQAQREWMLEFEAPRRFVYRMKPFPAGALSSCRSHEVKANGTARCSYVSHFELKGWMMPLVRGLLGGKLQQGFAGMSEGIKRRAEQLWAERQSAKRA